MRPIHGAAPGISAADHYLAMRDNPKIARPANPSEAVATDALHRFEPPSKAHIKRLLRPRPEVTRAIPRPNLKRDTRLDFHKMVIAQLGGSLTVAAEDGPRVPQPREPGMATTLEVHRAEQAERERVNIANEDAKAARKRLAWRAVATGQGELFA